MQILSSVLALAMKKMEIRLKMPLKAIKIVKKSVILIIYKNYSTMLRVQILRTLWLKTKGEIKVRCSEYCNKDALLISKHTKQENNQFISNILKQ